MKNKKIIILTVVITVVSIIILELSYIKINDVMKNKKTKNIGVISAEKINYELPTFSIVIDGIYDSTLTNFDLNDIDKYYIKAVTTDNYYNTYNEFVGVRLNDVLRKLEVDSFSKMYMKSTGGLSVYYERKDMSDDIYLTFEKNGIRYYDDEPVAVISPNFNEKFSVYDLISITFE